MDAKAKISSFFIFNSTLCDQEGEALSTFPPDKIHFIQYLEAVEIFCKGDQKKGSQKLLAELKKLLFFYPREVSPDARKLQVGLCEALIKFMSTFSSEPCEALQTQTKRHILYQPEKSYWMVLIVQIPYSTKALSVIQESKDDMIEPAIMKNFLVSAYDMYKMFMGPFSDTPVQELYSKCEQFFTPYITSRTLTNEVSNVIPGICYLPLDRNCFLNALCFIDLVEVNYPAFRCVSFVYNDQLIWNSLSTEDMLTLYRYLVQTLIPDQVEKEIQGGAVAAAQRHGRFISPLEGIRTEDDLQKLTKVYLRHDDSEELKQYYLVVYRTLSATISFSIDVSTPLELEVFRSLDAFIGPQLSSIASTISEQCALHALQSAQITTNPDMKFVYFNRLNYAFKTSPPVNKLVASTAVKPEVLSILSSIHNDKKSLGNYGEIVIKTPDEHWITGKFSNDREFYVVIQQKNANLKEIADEVKRICEAHMRGIFFYPT